MCVLQMIDSLMIAVYVRRRPRVRLEPLMSGGGQERGLRSGTLPTPLVVGLGEAAQICTDEMEVSHRCNSLLFQFMCSSIR